MLWGMGTDEKDDMDPSEKRCNVLSHGITGSSNRNCEQVYGMSILKIRFLLHQAWWWRCSPPRGHFSTGLQSRTCFKLRIGSYHCRKKGSGIKRRHGMVRNLHGNPAPAPLSNRRARVSELWCIYTVYSRSTWHHNHQSMCTASSRSIGTHGPRCSLCHLCNTVNIFSTVE